MKRPASPYTRMWIAFAAAAVLAGCATAQKSKPRTIGETIGSGIDQTIIWTSKGIQKLLNRENER